MSDNLNTSDPNAEISQLRDQAKTLLNERVSPAISQAADTAKQYAASAGQYASDAREMYADQAEALSERVREAPVMAVLIAAGVGYILGRVAR